MPVIRIEMSELISVIVPVFNVRGCLPFCLKSISEQTYPDLEIILVDDGSTDGSDKVCDDFAAKDMRCKVIHQCNGGAFSARNAGIEASSGEYLMFPDADDYFHRDFIRLLWEALSLYPECGFAMCGRKITDRYDEDTASAVHARSRVLMRDEYVAEIFKATDSYCVYQWNKLYRKRAVKDLRLRRYALSQDWDFNFRFFLSTHSAVLVENVLYYWVQHSGSLTHSAQSVQKYFQCKTEILYRNFKDLPEESSVYSPLLLDSLYRKMVFWRAKSLGFGDVSYVRRQCREYREDTIQEFLTCKKIPLYERMLWPLLLRMPHFTLMILRLTGNM